MSQAQANSDVLLRYAEAQREELRRQGIKSSKKIAIYGAASVFGHVLIMFLITWLNFGTDIVKMQIEWSDQNISGIGTMSDPMKGPENREGAAVVQAALTETPEDSADPDQEPGADVEEKPEEPLASEGPDPEHAIKDGDASRPTDVAEAKPRSNLMDGLKSFRIKLPSPSKTPEPTGPTSELPPATAEDGEGLFPAEELPGLEAFGPGNMRIIFLFRNDRIRGSEFEEPLVDLLKAFPDYKLLLQGSGLDPINDIDAIVIASNNLNRVSQTFTAIRHNQSDKQIKKLLTKRFLGENLEWSDFSGRPHGVPTPRKAGFRYARDVYLAAPGLAILLQPHLMPMMHQPPATASKDGQVMNEKRKVLGRSLLETLENMEQVDGVRDRNHAVFLAIKTLKLSAFHKKLPKLPDIRGGSASVSAGENPEMMLRFDFANEEDARLFLKNWPLFAAKLPSLFPLIPGLGRNLGSFEFRHRGGSTLYGEGRLEGWLVGMLLSTAKGYIESRTQALNQ